jgi:hypothetical protein
VQNRHAAIVKVLLQREDIAVVGAWGKLALFLAAMPADQAQAISELLAPHQKRWKYEWRENKAAAIEERKQLAPLAVRKVLDGFLSGVGEQEKKHVSRAVAQWLVEAHAAAHADPATKRLARLVLGVEDFARELERAGVWVDPYKAGLQRHLQDLGAPLRESFVQQKLKAMLGEIELRSHELVAKDKRRCEKEGKKHVLRCDIEGIVPMPKEWSFAGAVERQRCERRYLHILVMMAQVLNKQFHQIMRRVLGAHILDGEGLMAKNKDGTWRLTPEKGVARMEW